jgi:hypothetical protein
MTGTGVVRGLLFPPPHAAMTIAIINRQTSTDFLIAPQLRIGRISFSCHQPVLIGAPKIASIMGTT